jgi:hypothetical protein
MRQHAANSAMATLLFALASDALLAGRAAAAPNSLQHYGYYFGPAENELATVSGHSNLAFVEAGGEVTLKSLSHPKGSPRARSRVALRHRSSFSYQNR